MSSLIHLANLTNRFINTAVTFGVLPNWINTNILPNWINTNNFKQDDENVVGKFDSC